MNAHGPDSPDIAVDQLWDMAHRRSAVRYEPKATGLDRKLIALAGLGAALALCSPSQSLRSLAEHAMAAGATREEVLGVLMAVAPTIGTARVVSNTPMLALALGYDVDAALEDTESTAEKPGGGMRVIWLWHRRRD